MPHRLGKTGTQYEAFQQQRFQPVPSQPKEIEMFHIYFSENNEGKTKIKMECFETRESIDSAIRFIVTLWPEENPVQQIAMITNAATNTVVATIMRGPNGECVVTISDLPNPKVQIYSVMYDHITCPMCNGRNMRADPCINCNGKGTKLTCRVVQKDTVINLPAQVTTNDEQYDDDVQ